MLHTKVLQYDAATHFVWRAAMIGLARDLNYTIVQALIRRRREQAAALAAQLRDVDSQGGQFERTPTIDDFNEMLSADAAKKEEKRVREEQGFAVEMDPIELAARMKMLRDWAATELRLHARVVDGKINGYDLARSLSEEFDRQLSRNPSVNPQTAALEAARIGVSAEEITRIQMNTAISSKQFLVQNKADIMQDLAMLCAVNPDGHEYTIEEAEQIEETLPAIHRARMYVAVDRGLYYERDRQVGLALRRVPDALGNIAMIDAARLQHHANFDHYMSKPSTKVSIEAAVERGAPYPVMMPLMVQKQTDPAKAVAEALTSATDSAEIKAAKEAQDKAKAKAQSEAAAAFAAAQARINLSLGKTAQ